MEFLLEIKYKSSTIKSLPIYSTNDVYEHLRNLEINKFFEFSLYRRNKHEISDHEVLSLKNSNKKLFIEYSNQNNFKYASLNIKNVKSFEIHIWRFLINDDKLNHSKIFFEKLTHEENLKEKNYLDWKEKYVFQRKKEKRRNVILTCSILLFMSSIVIYNYINSSYYKFKYKEVGITKAEIYQTGYAPIGRGLNKQYVVYEFKYNEKYYTGRDRTNQIMLGFGKGEKKIGDIINIKFIKSDPTVNKIY